MMIQAGVQPSWASILHFTGTFSMSKWLMVFWLMSIEKWCSWQQRARTAAMWVHGQAAQFWIWTDCSGSYRLIACRPIVERQCAFVVWASSWQMACICSTATASLAFGSGLESTACTSLMGWYRTELSLLHRAVVNIALWIIITLHTWLMLPVRFHSNHHSYYHSTYTYNLITTMQTKISYSFTTHDGVLGSRFTMRYSQCDIHNAIFTTARCPRTSMDFWQSACVVHALDLKLMKVEWYLAVFGQRQLLPRRTAPSRRAFGRGNQVHVYITTFIICCYCCHVYITTFIWQQ